ncbi:MAG: response regulator [Thermoplasmatota archaeon]
MLNTISLLGEAGDRSLAILVVDDEPDIRDGIRRILEKTVTNARVLTARDGVEGLEALRTQKIDLIITDYKMPRMNGMELIHEAARLYPNAPRILITAFEQELANDLAANDEVACVLTKPLDPRPLVDTCRRMLSQP